MTALVALTVPSWGLTMTEGTVGEWLIGIGDAFGEGDEVVELETSKINGVVEAPFGSVLRRAVAQPGATLPVGALLGVCADRAASDADIDAFVAEFERTFVPPAPADAADALRFSDLGGCRVAWQCAGDGDGVPALLLHGFGGDMQGWLGVLPSLARGRRVYLLDLPGHGASSLAAPTFARLTSIVGEFLDDRGVGRVHLIGHSLGGGLALASAASQPERCAGVSLIAPIGLSPAIDQTYLDGFVDGDSRKTLKATLERLVADPSLVDRRFVDDALKYLRIDGVRDFLRALGREIAVGGRQQVALNDAVAKIGCPVRAVWGDVDRIVPPPPGAVRGVEIERIAGVGHLPQVEAMRETVARLVAWMDREQT